MCRGPKQSGVKTFETAQSRPETAPLITQNRRFGGGAGGLGLAGASPTPSATRLHSLDRLRTALAGAPPALGKHGLNPKTWSLTKKHGLKHGPQNPAKIGDSAAARVAWGLQGRPQRPRQRGRTPRAGCGPAYANTNPAEKHRRKHRPKHRRKHRPQNPDAKTRPKSEIGWRRGRLAACRGVPNTLGNAAARPEPAVDRRCGHLAAWAKHGLKPKKHGPWPKNMVPGSRLKRAFWLRPEQLATCRGTP